MTSITCAVSSVQLNIKDLSTVQNAVTPVAHKFLVFGSNISVPHYILAEIGKTNCDFDEKLYKVLEYRLKQLPLLTWHDIVRALRSPAVHEQVLACEIESQYIPCSSSQAQLVSDQSSTEHLDSKTKSQQEDRIKHRKRRHSPPHEKSCKRPRKTRKPRRACKKYVKQPRLPHPHSKPLVNMSSNAERLCPSPWSEGLLGDFIKYLKSLYRSCPVEKRTNVLKLQNPGNVFINLAFIDRKTVGLRTEYDEITEAMVRDGNVDVIEGRKCPIDMNKIAANLPATTLETVILVEGAPGVGKSTFAWEFCRRWERGEIAQQYDLVLLLRLRDDRISKAKCWKDLIYHSSQSILQAVISELEARSGFGVLFILEGYDELPDECRHPSSPLLKLISGEELHLATLMITSRPWATCDVLKKFKHCIFQHIEVLGFTKSQISSYIQSVLSVEEVEDLEKKLLKHDPIRKCMYIPLNCAIVVMVYQESKASGNDMPSTLTELYLALSHTILLRYSRSEHPDSNPIESFEKLSPCVHRKFMYLCELAYCSIAEGDSQVKLIFTDLPEDFDGLGFMDSVFELYVTRKAVASHNFLHLTFQEFLAAVHISNMEAEQRLQHFKRHEEGRLRVVLRFLAGITKLKDFSTPSSFVGLFDQPREDSYTAIDYTIRPHVCTWVYEALREEIIRTTFHDNVTVEFAGDNHSDAAALGYCMTHSQCKWVLSVSGWMKEYQIDLLIDESQSSDIGRGVIVGLRGRMTGEGNPFLVTPEGLHKIFTGLNFHLNELSLEIHTKCSDISWPDLSSLESLTLYVGSDEIMNWQLDYLLLPHLSLSSLVLYIFPPFSLEDCEAVADYILKTSTLKNVHIGVMFVMDEMFSVTEMDKIFAAVVEKELRPYFLLKISDRAIMDNNDAEKLANYIRTTALSKLMFPDLIFSSFGALQIARALREVPDLIADKLFFFLGGPSDFLHAIQLIEYFDLIDERMEEIDEYNVSFSFLLPDSTTVEWRFYAKGGIDDVGLQHMAEALCNKPSIKALTLMDFKISDVGAKALAEALNSNNVLEELDLTGTEIGIVGTEALAQAIGLNTTLKKLSLCDNDVGPDGAKALAELLNCNTFLKELDLSWNKYIGSVGTEALAQAIGSNRTLKKLILYGNDVGDAGAKALAEGLNCNTILEELHLSCNEIGDVGAEALVQAVGSNTALKKLVLSGNGVSDVGAFALAQALHSNSSLEVLNLSRNCIGDSGAKAFAEVLHHNSTITHLNLSDNKDIDREGVHHLIRALTVNDSISENGLTLDREGSECTLNCSGYRRVEHKIAWH